MFLISTVKCVLTHFNIHCELYFIFIKIHRVLYWKYYLCVSVFVIEQKKYSENGNDKEKEEVTGWIPKESLEPV